MMFQPQKDFISFCVAPYCLLRQRSHLFTHSDALGKSLLRLQVVIDILLPVKGQSCFDTNQYEL